MLLGAIGVALLLWLVWNALRDAYQSKIAKAKATHVRGDFILGAALSLANPGAIAFWLGIGSTVIATGKAAPDLSDLLMFLPGFLSGALLWSFFLAGLTDAGRRGRGRGGCLSLASFANGLSRRTKRCYEVWQSTTIIGYTT
jgi:threonine/homoserine/homoserine lactone efflux protein